MSFRWIHTVLRYSRFVHEQTYGRCILSYLDYNSGFAKANSLGCRLCNWGNDRLLGCYNDRLFGCSVGDIAYAMHESIQIY